MVVLGTGDCRSVCLLDSILESEEVESGLKISGSCTGSHGLDHDSGPGTVNPNDAKHVI